MFSPREIWPPAAGAPFTMRIEIYNDDNTLRGVLGIEPECKVDDFADELRLLCQIAGYTAKQARDILPTSEDWDRFIDEMKTIFSANEP